VFRSSSSLNDVEREAPEMLPDRRSWSCRSPRRQSGVYLSHDARSE
jgi:hypothetical protein